MSDFQAEKAVVRAHFAAIKDDGADGLAAHTAPDWHWRGMHPFYEQRGAATVARVFWKPFLNSFSKLQRREDIFFAGANTVNDDTGVWVVSMGHLMGLFDRAFINIPPTRKIAMLRYAEFNKVVDGEIVETAMFCDLLHLMTQAGVNPMAPQTGVHLVQPGPMTHDGLLLEKQDQQTGTDTLALINRMIGDIGANSNTADNTPPRDATPQDELARCWHDDMLWWGPEGIGATYTIDRYIDQHQRPFRTQLGDRAFHGHKARLAEGNYGAFFGWANLSVVPLGGYMGLPGNGRDRVEMRVVDVYRRDGDKLAENWIFIDILYFLQQQGLDVLARLDKS